ncbi:MAG: proline dehydrogenase family protein [Gemmatimonadales bacterium]|nr:proline dehydrogenase family protein [Gemmatimonadales bacterium]
MLRPTLLWLSERRAIAGLVPDAMARRFVAGDTVQQAVQAAVELQAKGITTTLDLLGESVHSPAETEAACATYVDMVQRMAAARLEVNVSVKLTQMGFDLDETLCLRNVARILDAAKAADGFVRLDMEGSAYTQRTLDFYRAKLRPLYGDHCGVVLQSMLRRTDADVAALCAEQVRVRLCKGAYLEPAAVAFPEKSDVDFSYVRNMERLMAEGHYPGLATHDEAIIRRACAFARERGIGPERFEFQMLYGVRRDLQLRLRQDGWRVRVYLPFGTQWYPYLMRRLAERPANIAFILGNMVREALPGR